MQQKLIQELSVITDEEKAILEKHTGIDKTIYTEEQELIVDCEKLLQEGELIQIRPHTRFVHFPKHKHNYVEVVYMCKGSTTHIINGSEIVLREGDLLFLNQNSEQEILPAGKEDIAVNFIILPEFFGTAFEMMGKEDNLLKDFLIRTLCGKNGETSYLYFEVSDVLPIQNLIENMVWTLFYDMENKRSCNQITIGLLMLQLLNHMDKMHASKGAFEMEVMKNVSNYIEEHYKEGSLAKLAKRYGYDMFWLSREVKKQTGYTFIQLVQEKRVNQACYLLKNTSLPVVDIITSVGYDNTSYFHRKFKSKFGCSPKQYRKSIKTE
ncbi:MAG: AraC family transcriptional regulator [Lachnospiraceae bacterium]|nr:AraC family transcriptional regulator [Lachnospiraceae bacterium]